MLRQTEVVVSGASGTKQLVVARIAPKDGMSALLAVTVRHDGQHRLVIPPADFPRLFVTFPIAGTHFLPFNVVVERPVYAAAGNATVSQWMEAIGNESLRHYRRCPVSSGTPSNLTGYMRIGWPSWLSQTGRLVAKTIAVNWNGGQHVIRDIANATASEPIIETEIGRLPALSQDGVNAASFLVPAFDADNPGQFDYRQLHELATVVKGLSVPNEDVARDWENIALDWHEAGVPVDRLGLKELTSRIRSASDAIGELPIDGNPFHWLASLVLVVAELGEDYNPGSLVDGLVPDQHGQLRRRTRPPH